MAKRRKELNFEEAVFDDQARTKDLEYLETPLSAKVFVLVFAVLILAAAIVVGRLAYLNFILGKFYKQRASANVNKEIIIPALRGVITDRFGKIIARNTAASSVYINTGELLKPKNIEKLDQLTENLGDIMVLPADDIKKIILKSDLEKNNFVLLEPNVSMEESIAVQGLNSEFIEVVNDYTRDYIDGPVFAHVIGYTGLAENNNFIEGRVGLERQYNDVLRGKPGVIINYKDAKGNIFDKKIVADATPGNLLALSIDADLQRYFYERLLFGLRSLNTRAGVGLAINPQNGEVLSLISLPSFDNNIFVSRSKSNQRKSLLEDPGQPLFNRAVSGTYNPGSTIKPLLALAALKEKIAVPELEIYSRGYIEVPNPYNPEEPSVFVDWKPHGWVDIRSALARSSNIYFYALGGGLPRSEGGIVRGISFGGKFDGLGIYKLKEYWQKFGFGQKTGIDLSGEGFGFLPDPEEKTARKSDIWRLGDTYNVSIGQGDLLVTALQLINFVGSIANGGKGYQLRLTKSEEQPRPIIDYSDWMNEIKEVQLGMEDAISKPYGTAYWLVDLPMRAAGKTGSAQVFNNTRTNAFFIGYAPAENPQIAILVLVENSREGSLNAVPIARDVLEWYYYNRIKN